MLSRQNQLELETKLHRETARRLGVYDECPSLQVSETPDYYYEYDSGGYESEGEEEANITPSVTPKNELQLARNKLRLYNVSIHPCILRGRRGMTVSGTLETHANGFRYKNYSIPFKLDIMFQNVKNAFFQDGDETMAPLCHLHLHNPIMVGSEMTKDIQFRMVQSKDDSALIRNFLAKVNPICLQANLFRFSEVKKIRGFYGELTLKEHLTLPAVFVFTFTCLVQLEYIPFTVVVLREIEVVNLVHDESGIDMISMTIVFKDFTRDVLQISSIPLPELIGIRETLDLSHVKYYESPYSINKLDIPLWRYVLKQITDNPKTFIEEGGWNFLNSGNFINRGKLFQLNPSGITYFSDIESGQASDRRNKMMPLSVTTRTKPVGKRVMASSSESEFEFDSSPKVNEKEIKHTARKKLFKTARRRIVMSDESDDEERER